MAQSRILSLALMAGLMAATPALASGSSRDAVIDERGGKVVDSRGNCVRTKWMEANDPCAPPAPPPVPVAEPAPVPPPPPPAPTRQLHKGDLTVYFDFDKSSLTQESSAKLDRLAALLKEDVTVKGARIVGYTDSIGKRDYNMKLSQKRADVVNDYIRSRGYLGTTSAEVRAFGPENPVTDCSSVKGRTALISCKAPDRRVEIEIEYVQ
jgi:OOP family OmpA-OmpF porin